MAGLLDSLQASLMGLLRNAGTIQQATVKGVYDVATAAMDDGDTGKAWDDFAETYRDSSLGILGNSADIVGRLMDTNPVTRSVKDAGEFAAETAETVYHETVGRGVSTGLGVLGEADTDEDDGLLTALGGSVAAVDDAKALFDPDAWSRAYAASDTISPGQMWAGVQADMSLAEIEAARARGDFAKGGLAWATGTADFMTRAFDPVNLVGKGLQISRLKHIRPIDNLADAAKYVESDRFGNVEKVITKAKSEEEIRLRLLNNNSNGAAVAHVLWNTRHDPELLRIGTRAAFGDEMAMVDLWRYNKVLAETQDMNLASGVEAADVLGRFAAGQPRRTRLMRIGTEAEEPGDWETYVAGLRTNEQLFNQLTVLRPELLTDVARTAPLLSTNPAIPKAALRDTYSSRLRFAVHQSSYYGSAPVIVRQSAQKLLSSNRRIHGINFDDSNSDQAVRSYLERAGLPEEQKTKLLSDYMSASANKSMKLSVMVRAQEAVIRHMGDTYGYSKSDVNDIVAKAAQGAGRARLMLARQHEFASEDVQKQFVDEGSVVTWTDEGGTAHAMPIPVLESQMMDIFPVADPGQLHSAMKNAVSRDRGLGVRATGSKVLGDVTAGLDFVHRLWKPVVLVGLGYPVRMLSDEVGRQIALYGIADVAMSSGKGFTNSARDAVERGRAQWDFIVKERNRDRVRTLKDTLDPQVPAEARWRDLAHAFSEGAISRKEFTETSREAAKRGMTDMFTAARFADEDFGIKRGQEFERALVDKALAREGRNWFWYPQNQRGLIQQVQESGRVHLNPLTGEEWKPQKGSRQVGKTMVLTPDDVRGHADNTSHIYDFVYDHSDDLLREGAGIQARMRPTGQIELKAFRRVKPGAERKQDAQRFKKEFVSKSRSAGNRGFQLELEPGVVQHFDGAYEGAGDRFRKESSSDSVHVDYMLEQHGLAADRVAVSAGWSKAIDAAHVDYAPAWERAVNLQLANDPAARQFLEFRDYDMVKNWAETEPEGKRWAREMAVFGDLDSRLQRVEAMVESYVPRDAGLDDLVLRQVATHDDLLRAIPDESLRPQVHGEVLDFNLGMKSAVGTAYRRAMNKTMEKLGTIPSDKLSRYPFFTKSYRNHLTTLARNQYRPEGEMIPVARAEELQMAARKLALADVRKWLYNSDMTSDGVTAIRHFSPFAAAWQDGMKAWGRLAFQKPQSMAYIYQLWHAPERAGLIVDSAGRELSMEAGKEVWYEVDPESGARTKAKGPADENRYVQFMLPSWMSPKEFGEDVTVPLSINKNSFNTFIHLDPGAGPIVAVGASEFTKRDIGIKYSDNELMRRIIPYGPSDTWYKPLLSNELRNLVEVIRGEDDSVFRNQTMMIMQAEIVKYNQGRRTTKPTFEEAADKAGDLKLMRLALTATMPVSPQFKSPFQAHIDAYRQLNAADPTTADEKFFENYGEDYFVLTARVTQGVKGLPPTMEGYKQLKKYRDLVAEYPEIAGAIIGSTTGEFNKSVYELYKRERIRPGSNKTWREIMSMEDSISDAETRLAWIKFQSMMDVVHADLADRGLYNVRDEGAEDLLEKRDALIQQIGFKGDGSPTEWYGEYSTREPAVMLKKLAGFRQVATDERMLGREDIQGLADYLAMRQDFKAELKLREESGGAKTLEAKANADLNDMWNQAVFSLKDRNLQFASLYDRYLQQDDLEV